MTDNSKDITYGIFQTPQNRKLISKIESQNRNLFKFQPVEIKTNEFTKEEVLKMRLITQYDWIVFTDIYAVGIVLEELEKENFDFYEFDNVRICAFGEAVADRLRFVQIHSDIIPQKMIVDEIADAIVKYANQGNLLENLKILVVSGEKIEYGIAEKLKNKKAIVEELTVYDCLESAEFEKTKLKTLIKGGAIEEFIFCSVEDVIQFKIIFGKEFLRENIFETVWGTDEITLKTLDEFGIKAFYWQK